MTRINDLISIFDNTPVEYQNLGKLAEIGTGSSNGNEAETSGCFPFFVRSKFVKYKNTYEYDEEAVIVPGEGGVGEIYHYINGKYSLHQRAYRIHVLSDKLDTKFLYYYMSSHFKTYINSKAVFSTVKSLRKPMFLEFKIPLPPIEIQREIVKILDVFKNMEAELEAELEARKKQYSYYRDSFLDFNSHNIFTKKHNISKIEFFSLGEICTILRGASPRPIKSFITEDKSGINWIKIGDVSPNSKYITQTKEKITTEGAKHSRFLTKNSFILSNSMSFGRPYILKIDGCIHDGWLSISDFEENLDSDYLYYILTSTQIQNEMAQKASFGGAVQNLNADIVKAIKIPVPPLEIQKEIAMLLNHFEVLCNDLTAGLPAEIEARRKQYEYYRDKLLSFKDLEN